MALFVTSRTTQRDASIFFSYERVPRCALHGEPSSNIGINVGIGLKPDFQESLADASFLACSNRSIMS